MKKALEVSLFLVMLFFSYRSYAQPTIVTVAGNGVYSYSGDGGPATGAQLLNPSGQAIDDSGNIYIADTYNNRIRKINTSGVISTIAGNGIAGYSGEGNATAVELDTPAAVAVDDTGNVYIADTHNNRIRKVNTSGIISTIAGTGTAGYSGEGVALLMQLNYPCGIAIDTFGNIYIADGGNNRIRKINSSGIISTIAGTGIAGYIGEGVATAMQVNAPEGVCVDATGNVYIGDTRNHRVRKVNTSGIISSIAGTGTGGYTGEGIATIKELNYPIDVSVDTSGNIFIGDCYNNRIRKIDASGVISTVAGNGTLGYNGEGVATAVELNLPNSGRVDKHNNLIITDGNNNRIRKVDTSGNISTISGTGFIQFSGDGGPAIGAELSNAASVALDAGGNLYIADGGNSVLRKVSPTGSTITTIAGIPGVSGFSGDGGAALSAKLANPTNIGVSPTGDIVFCDSGNACLRKVSPTGSTITTIAGNATLGAGYSGDGVLATDAQISNTVSFCFDSSGNIYLLDGGNSCLRKVSSTGSTITTIAGTPGVAGFSGDGGPASSAKFDHPTAIAIDTAGNIYIADGGNSCLRKVSSTGSTITTIAGTPTVAGFGGDGGPASAALFNNPSGIAVSSSGRIFISDAGNSRMRVIDPATGNIKTVVGTDTAGFNGDGLCTDVEINHPVGVCLDAYYNCYIADRFNNRIRYVSYTALVSALDQPQSDMRITPNPSNGRIEINISSPANAEVQYVITNVMGERVGAVNGYTNRPVSFTMDVPPGLYMVSARAETGNWNGKVIVTR